MTNIANLDPQNTITGSTNFVVAGPTATDPAKLAAYSTLLAKVLSDVISDNLVTPSLSKSLSQAGVLSLLGTYLEKDNNLSDLASIPAARDNLGISGYTNKNAIINGGFNIWQRGTSFISVADASYTADRWQYFKTGTMVHDISRSTDVPTVAEAGRVINYSLLADCTTADASMASNDQTLLIQKIEGYNFLPLAQKPLTVSFWVKATKIGTYCITLQDSISTRSCVKEYTVTSPDIWEFKTLTFPASPSGGTWNYTNGNGLQFFFTLAAGSGYNTTPDTWQVGDFRSTSNQVNACDSVTNNFKVTGVQIEEGSTATSFESRTIQQEQYLCERYYQGVFSAAAWVNTSTSAAVKCIYRQEMRSEPTAGLTGPLNAQNGIGSSTQSSANISSAAMSKASAFLILGNFNFAGHGNSVALSCPTIENNSNYITLNAEL